MSLDIRSYRKTDLHNNNNNNNINSICYYLCARKLGTIPVRQTAEEHKGNTQI